MNQILSLNPQLRGMFDMIPQLREMMQNPDLLRQLTNPETIQLGFSNFTLAPYKAQIIKNIERREARISCKDEIMKAIGKKLDKYKNPWLELKIQYG
ncbi:putative chromatin-remodeling complex ATPase chain [Morella rubra]|uniref:Putative chromatin-remodeling complex ATPase chain n=1 Tax=Morella rubra TaxID=262757 RepID=A0A6A1UYU0_9ROSI|nr:putative chromatin-remodeling complex ATPase chain [Morella rubra]KAB1205576.1 putative chromatin-remodeling complex ATPase chain [Morella rubra]